MNKILLLTALVTIVVVSGCSSSITNSKKLFNNLNWMEGKWVSTDVNNYTEVWKRINDTCYQGFSMSPADKDSLVEERLQIVLRKNTIHFINKIEEQTEEAMTQDLVLITNTPDSLVFTNKGLNYPNRITYKKLSDTLIKVNVERAGDENQIKFEYTLKKMQ